MYANSYSASYNPLMRMKARLFVSQNVIQLLGKHTFRLFNAILITGSFDVTILISCCILLKNDQQKTT
jgi:hypothetical protein